MLLFRKGWRRSRISTTSFLRKRKRVTRRKSRNSRLILRRPKPTTRGRSRNSPPAMIASAWNQLLRDKSVSLAESEARGRRTAKPSASAIESCARSFAGFWTKLISAAARLRSSARWQLANPVAALKAKLLSSAGLVRLRASGKSRLDLPKVADYSARCCRH